MTQEPIEMILLRHWASYVAMPIWLADPAGDLIYYNEPAESLLGGRFEDAREIPAEELAEIFVTTDLDGAPIPSSELPLVVALTDHVPAHRVLRFRALDGSSRVIEVLAIPIEGQGGRHLGAMATFWEPI
jgi:PAS domain-containing protein